MNTNNKIGASELIELCNYPICSIEQITWKSILESGDRLDTWGGCTPVISVCFEDQRNSCLYVAATDHSLVFCLSHSDDYNAVIDLVNQISEFDCDPEELVGTFDLYSVVSPVPGWENLDITKVSVITTTKSEDVVGLCMGVNLGIRLGLIVAPHPGISLSFNDTCDTILAQAEKSQEDGLVHIVTKEYQNKETPGQVDTIDWFDWLRVK